LRCCFLDDPRAPQVETAAADTLFSLAQYQQAMDLADHLIRTRPDLIRVVAHRVCHSPAWCV
jgi:hypothetical protein